MASDVIMRLSRRGLANYDIDDPVRSRRTFGIIEAMLKKCVKVVALAFAVGGGFPDSADAARPRRFKRVNAILAMPGVILG